MPIDDFYYRLEDETDSESGGQNRRTASLSPSFNFRIYKGRDITLSISQLRRLYFAEADNRHHGETALLVRGCDFPPDKEENPQAPSAKMLPTDIDKIKAEVNADRNSHLRNYLVGFAKRLEDGNLRAARYYMEMATLQVKCEEWLERQRLDAGLRTNILMDALQYGKPSIKSPQRPFEERAFSLEEIQDVLNHLKKEWVDDKGARHDYDEYSTHKLVCFLYGNTFRKIDDKWTVLRTFAGTKGKEAPLKIYEHYAKIVAEARREREKKEREERRAKEDAEHKAKEEKHKVHGTTQLKDTHSQESSKKHGRPKRHSRPMCIAD